jgi:Domain of unknown function (DUF4838)/Glycosyl hydrolase family 67 N-terminus
MNRRSFLQYAGAVAGNVPNLERGSLYSIVTAPDAPAAEQRAARELQYFLEQMNGTKLPIVTTPEKIPRKAIFVGRSAALESIQPDIAFDALGTEGFVLKTVGSHLVIVGGRPRGTMYGVYTYLDKLGCRWFTADVSRIPKLSTIPLGPFNETHQPAFEYREPFFSEALDKEWAARNRVNGNFLNLDESTGGKVQYYPFVHSFLELVPPERYFKDHPEYFSLIDGKRRAERGQLCLTNPGVLRAGVDTVLEWIQKHPEATIYSVSQNDWTGWCECEICRKAEIEEGGVHSGPLLRYVNALAAEIEKTHPEKLIDTLAYWYTEEPPSTVRPRRNVRIRLCPIGTCVAHPFKECPNNAYFMNNLRAWFEITKQLYIWHYNTNFRHFLLPFPDFDELAADIPMYHRHGVVGLFLEGAVTTGGGAENAELRSYVMARLLWDVNTNVRQDIEDFHHGYYGNASGPMVEYFDLMQQQVRPGPQGKGSHLWIYDPVDSGALAGTFLDRAKLLFLNGAERAENETIRKRVRKSRLPIDYLEVTRTKRFSVKDGHFAPADIEGLRTRWRSFTTDASSFGISSFHEHYEIPADIAVFAQWVRPYSVITLQNASVAVHVVAELDGRVVSVFDKRNGKEVLLMPDAGDRLYPNLSGLWAAAYSDFVAKTPWDLQWTAQPGSSSDKVVLTGTATNGCKISRTLRLVGDEPLLETETKLHNEGDTPVEAALKATADVDPGDMAAVALVYRKRDGSPVERKLVQPGRQPASNDIYDPPDAPDGEWTIVNHATGMKFTNRFQNTQTGRFALNWRAKGDDLTSIGVWSERKVLRHGDSIELKADYVLG